MDGMKRLTIDLEKKDHAALKICAVTNNTDMRTIMVTATAAYLWSQYGILWNGYQPDDCPFCPHPIEDHTFIQASATEPASYECPDDDEVSF